MDIIHIQFQQYQVLGITYTYKYLSSDFGSGKENTRKLIEKWNAKEYGEQNTCTYGHKDIWGQIQTEVNRVWFVPSSGEWNAFSDEIGIWNGNYSSRGMSPIYWSSYCYNIKNGNVALEILLQIGCILLEVYIVMAQLENIMIVFMYV